MKAKITLRNILGYLQGNSRKIFKEWFNLYEAHIQEQAIWRLGQVQQKSLICFERDECKECGCQVSSRVFENRKCEGDCYPEMMSKEDWERFKQTKQYKESII